MENSTENNKFLSLGKNVFNDEIEELMKVRDRLDSQMVSIVELIYNSTGRLVITGIGKSGIIGKKLAASFASTGTKSFFINAAEGLHGDLGMIDKNDVVLAISNSGTTQEIIQLLPSLKKIGCSIISMTGDLNSELAKNSLYFLDIGVEKEADPMNLAPTTSTTTTLVMGDALVVCLIVRKNFKPENFAVYHPGGALGRRLLTRVENLMYKDIPVVQERTSLKDIIYEISSKRLGMTTVQDDNNQTIGVITDGDIRRHLVLVDNINNIYASDIMTTQFKKIKNKELANFALEVMDKYEISNLVVEDEESKKIIGVITITDLFNFKNK